MVVSGSLEMQIGVNCSVLHMDLVKKINNQVLKYLKCSSDSLLTSLTQPETKDRRKTKRKKMPFLRVKKYKDNLNLMTYLQRSIFWSMISSYKLITETGIKKYFENSICFIRRYTIARETRIDAGVNKAQCLFIFILMAIHFKNS